MHAHGAEGGNDGGARVAAQRVLQQARELGVPVRHVRAPFLRQRGDAVSQRRQRLVDVRQLLGTALAQRQRRVPLL